MYRNCCKKCGSLSLHTEVKGNNTGLYCSDCGAWLKWLGKDELRAFEHAANKMTVSNSSTDKEKTIIKRLEDFIVYLDAEINEILLSQDDAIRKSSYCLAIERDRNAIINILEGRDFDSQE